MYFVGSTPKKVGRKGRVVVLYPGAEIPEAATFPALRRMLSLGEIYCDYKDGELHPTEMAPVVKPRVRFWTELRDDLIKEGISVPEDVTPREIFEAHDIFKLFKEGSDAVPSSSLSWIMDQIGVPVKADDDDDDDNDNDNGGGDDSNDNDNGGGDDSNDDDDEPKTETWVGNQSTKDEAKPMEMKPLISPPKRKKKK